MKAQLFGIILVVSHSIASAGPDDKLPPVAYLQPVDQQIARRGVGVKGRPFPCSYEQIIGGSKGVATSPTELCVKLLPQRRWRGLWRNDFEGSRFCPEPATKCDHDTPGENIWLSETPDRAEGGLYSIDFLGRRTIFKGPYGHLGMSDHELLIDQVITVKLLEAPPPPPSKAEVIKEWKACEAAQTCIPKWAEINRMKD